MRRRWRVSGIIVNVSSFLFPLPFTLIIERSYTIRYILSRTTLLPINSVVLALRYRRCRWWRRRRSNLSKLDFISTSLFDFLLFRNTPVCSSTIQIRRRWWWRRRLDLSKLCFVFALLFDFLLFGNSPVRPSTMQIGRRWRRWWWCR